MSLIAKNNKAHYDYDIKDTFDAGLALSGAEVKSAKSGNVSLAGSYIKVDAHGAYLINCHIGPYKYAPSEGYDPTHSRKLLLNKKEIHSLLGAEKGLTIVPLEMYVAKRGLIKLQIGIGRGRKKQDKREYIKKRDIDREIRKEINR
jgi:SsrA-binding protein